MMTNHHGGRINKANFFYHSYGNGASNYINLTKKHSSVEQKGCPSKILRDMLKDEKMMVGVINNMIKATLA